jgi:hypothetical protein
MSLEGSEQAGGDVAGDPSVARRVHVQVIADVVGRVDLPGVGRVADRAVEIEYGVELVTGAVPGVRPPAAVRHPGRSFRMPVRAHCQVLGTELSMH